MDRLVAARRDFSGAEHRKEAAEMTAANFKTGTVWTGDNLPVMRGRFA